MNRANGLDKPCCVKIADADRNELFASGLEYNPPARGMWNIVHSGMLLPGAHEIFACAQGCLRGVILTAAEMLELDRLSWISVSQSDMFDGTLECDIIDGVCEIIGKLDRRPPVILLYLSCIHLFAGVDFEVIIDELTQRHPDITFVDCYMTPTMRQTVSPVSKMSSQLYAALKPLPFNNRAVGIVGNDRATDEDSELVRIIKNSGCEVRDITLCKSYEEYLLLAECALNISYIPTGYLAGDDLERRLGAKHLHLPARYSYDDLIDNYKVLCSELNIEVPDFSADINLAEKALKAAKEVIGDTPIAIDYTVVTRPFELAWLLYDHGFNVKHIIADSAAGEEDSFDKLCEKCPDLMIWSAANVNMLYEPEQHHEHMLALGQKAAYYFTTDNFVNIVVNGGYYGFSGIAKIAELMIDAYNLPKDRREVLKLKGMGCASCLV
ncbi:MAG: hypothetical protein IJ571_08650 [Ruminococcus sp.]|nr:hypothetical protein [Ruminococcus sp.]